MTLDDGTDVRTPTVAGDLGFPVSFWAVELPPGRRPQSADVGADESASTGADVTVATEGEPGSA